jgi:phosphotransferase system enzyme I (PtsI)
VSTVTTGAVVVSNELGLPIGAALVAIQRTQVIRFPVSVDRVARELSTLDRARVRSQEQLRKIRSRIAVQKGAQVRRGAERQGIPVSVCGEMASDPLLLPLLIGCGLTEFSMTLGALPRARRVIRDTSAGEMERIAARVLTLGTVDEIERFLFDAFGRQDVATEVSTP